MALTSALFRGDAKLEAAAVSDPAHVTPGARGDHVTKIQVALNTLDGAGLTTDGAYGPKTAAAVLAYKSKREIINKSYQDKADNVVGKLTVSSLDREMFARESRPAPAPPQPPAPGPHLNLNFSMTDQSINVTIVGNVTDATAKTKPVIDPATFSGTGMLAWKNLGEVRGKTALLKVEKRGSIFWVIAFVPDGTNVSHILHVFFHPTPVQVYPDKPGGKPVAHIIADDKTYDRFGADWKDLAQRYLDDMGPQLGAARKIPMLICLMRNAAAQISNATNDIFADRPLDTLFEILTVVSREIIKPGSDAPALPLAMSSVQIGTSSFSSGIAYHANLFNRIKNHGNYLEAIDLDSTYIRTAHLDISQQKPGPQVKRHGQSIMLRNSPIFWQFPPSRWNGKAPNAPTGRDAIGTPPSTGDVHHLIAFRTFFGAMQNSLLKP